MKCRADEVQDYVYGFLDPEAQGRCEAHIAVCPECRRSEERLGRERDLLAAAAAAPVPASRSLGPLIGAAAGLLALAGATAWVLSARWPAWRRVEISGLVPGGDATPPVTARSAIRATRSQRSYRVKFETTVRSTSLPSLTVEGESVWVSPGVFYARYAGSGGDQKRIIRVGDKVWVYHELLADWVTNDEIGMPRAGRDFENPDEVLAALDRGLPMDPRSLRFSIPARDLCHLIPGLDGRTDDAMSVAFTIAGTRLSTISFSMPTFSGTVWFEQYNKEESLDFVASGKPVPIPEAIRKEIREFRERKR